MNVLWFCLNCHKWIFGGNFCEECGKERKNAAIKSNTTTKIANMNENNTNKREKAQVRTYTITAERQSVCMGDDCNAPHLTELKYNDNTMLSEFMKEIDDYVPSMNNAAWIVRCDIGDIAYLISDAEGKYRYILQVQDTKVKDLGIEELFCKYETDISELGIDVEEDVDMTMAENLKDIN